MSTAGFSPLSHRTRSQVERPGVIRATAFDRWLGGHVQRTIQGAGVRLELWDGSSTYGGDRTPVGDLVVADRRALIGLVLRPDLYFGDGYMTGRIAVRGRFGEVIEALSRSVAAAPSWRERLASALTPPNSLGSSRRNVHHHYDLGNDFYRLWLDRELIYTCAYFEHPDVPLDDAQTAKLDLVCRKLRLQPGEVVVEAGCGWGALALHMARRYGVQVKAFNVSREQLEYARERAAREGLSGQVEFVDDDYRNVSGRFDVFVSVGMLEHVGLAHYRSLADVLRRTVRRAGGRGLLHFIGRDVPRPLNAWIRRRIFPGGYPPTLAEVATGVLAPAEMSVIDVENLRLHYARTLAHWRDRFVRAEEQIRTRYGDEFCRAWDLYLAGSEAAFVTGWMQLFQIVFAPRESAPPAWTRAEVYGARGAQA
jgi:cyclopropane-fatty-acyl-phospholipid synthase